MDGRDWSRYSVRGLKSRNLRRFVFSSQMKAEMEKKKQRERSDYSARSIKSACPSDFVEWAVNSHLVRCLQCLFSQSMHTVMDIKLTIRYKYHSYLFQFKSWLCPNPNFLRSNQIVLFDRKTSNWQMKNKWRQFPWKLPFCSSSFGYGEISKTLCTIWIWPWIAKYIKVPSSHCVLQCFCFRCSIVGDRLVVFHCVLLLLQFTHYHRYDYNYFHKISIKKAQNIISRQFCRIGWCRNKDS